MSLPRSAWIALAVGTLSQLSTLIGPQAIGPLAPLLQADWGLSRTQVGMLVAAFFTGASVSPFPAGGATDRHGVRPMLFLCSAGVGLALLVVANAPLWAWALVAMLLAGTAGGIGGPATSKAIVLWFPERLRATAMSAKHLGMPGSGALAALAVPVVVAAYGWRGALLAAGLFALGVAVLVTGLYRTHPDERAGIRAKQGSAEHRFAPRWVALVLVSGTLFAAVQLASTTYMTLFVNEALALPLEVAWTILLLAQLGGVLGRLGWGIVSDRLLAGRRLPALLGAGATTTVATLAVSVVSPGVDTRLLGFLVLVLGAASVGWLGICLTLVSEMVGPPEAGAATGIVMTAANLGVVVGPPVFGLVVDLTNDYRLAWWLLAAAALAATALAARLREAPRPAAQPAV